mmetsp:Transcript_28265/g.76060  ORF Transcript_28265/g.76060 Transcript_28265/m.76060 type:complete len:742 (-) Transcript_28265:238-2463(-)
MAASQPQRESSRLQSLARVSGGAILGVASATRSALVSYVASARAGQPEGALSALSSAEVLRVANTLNALLQQSPGDDFKLPELPQMVVVGTQSSGKSSLLNGIMACDILPLGEAMVTRCPLQLQLVHAPADQAGTLRAEFGSYASGTWQAQRSFELTAPNPTPHEIAQIRDEIEAQTQALAGPGKGISAQPIHLRVHSAFVPDLTLVDLPGLTQMALVDQGQPRDIKQQIRALVQTHIEKERAVILAVLPARTDLEADAALELVKEVDPRGQRTIGVLTKVDLMNIGSDVSPYLIDDGRVPSDLRLDLGYYAVRNRSTSEVNQQGLTVEQGYERELAYFQSHPVYCGLRPHARARLGVPSLAKAMSRLLVASVQTHLPAILDELTEAHARARRDVIDLGPPIPSDDTSRVALAQSIVAQFCRDFVGSLTEKRAGVHTGRRIKDSFTRLRTAVHACDAVSPAAYPDAYITDAVRDCEGNHLSFPVPPIEVLEQLLQSPERRPIHQLLKPCVQAADEVRGELRDLGEALCTAPAIARFPRLRARVRDELTNNVIAAAHAEAVGKLTDLVAMEEAYIASEDPAFLQELTTAVKKLVSQMNPGLIRDILKSYYATVQRTIANTAPKAIMHGLVNGVRARVHAVLFEQLMKVPVGELLEEPRDMAERRKGLQERLDRLGAARHELEQCQYPSDVHQGMPSSSAVISPPTPSAAASIPDVVARSPLAGGHGLGTGASAVGAYATVDR